MSDRLITLSFNPDEEFVEVELSFSALRKKTLKGSYSLISKLVNPYILSGHLYRIMYFNSQLNTFVVTPQYDASNTRQVLKTIINLISQELATQIPNQLNSSWGKRRL